jgi:hypothetical protein
MFPYEKAEFEGRPLNFWEPSNGTVAHDRNRSTASGPLFGAFRVALRHEENDLAGGPRPVLRETWDVKVYNLADAFLFDLEAVQNCATDKPFVVAKNGYGGLRSGATVTGSIIPTKANTSLAKARPVKTATRPALLKSCSTPGRNPVQPPPQRTTYTLGTGNIRGSTLNLPTRFGFARATVAPLLFMVTVPVPMGVLDGRTAALSFH